MIKKIFHRLYRFVFGVDIFVSYSRRDATQYAEKLATAIQDENFKCYIDRWKAEPGKTNSYTVRMTLRHSALLVILATENAVTSKSVEAEVVEFLKTGRVIVLVDFGSAKDASWYPYVRGLPLSEDTMVNLANGDPSELVLKRIINAFVYQKQSYRLKVTALATLGVLLLMIGLITYSGFRLKDIQNQKKRSPNKSGYKPQINYLL